MRRSKPMVLSRGKDGNAHPTAVNYLKDMHNELSSIGDRVTQIAGSLRKQIVAIERQEKERPR